MAAVLLVLVCAAGASAHEFWLQPEGSAWRLVLGHGDDLQPYRPEVLKKVQAWDARGRPVEVPRAVEGGAVVFRPSSAVVEIDTTVDQGYWVKTVRGWKNKTRREEPRNVDSYRALEYGRMLLRGTAVEPRGLPLEIVLQEGDVVQVLLRGRPLAGVPVESGHRRLGVTDAEGRARLKLEGSGWTVLAARHREPLEGDPDAAALSLTAVLGFRR